MLTMDATPLPVAVEKVNTRYLETLLGYNARRAALAIIEQFLIEMADYSLRPVEFSVLSLIAHNPGITSRQVCSVLGILAPNLVGMLNTLEKRDLIGRHPHPTDGRAMGLVLTPTGVSTMQKAEKTASQLELRQAKNLSADERKQLIRLLKKIYK